MSKNVIKFARKFPANTILLDGNHLTTESAVKLGQPDSCIIVAPEAKHRVAEGRLVVDRIIEEGKPVYGINTGFGVNSSVSIDSDQLEQLQRNLILSHATGSGEALPMEYARTMVALRINTLLRGNSGIRMETVQRMVDLFNLGITPKVPTFGSVGASGDLVPLARIAAAYFEGKGELWDPRIQAYGKAEEVLKAYGFEPNYPWKAKEGLALINGTQYITALGSHASQKAEQAFNAAEVIAAMSLVAIKGHRDAFMPFVYETRPQSGAKEVADTMYGLTAPRIDTTSKDPQDPYSYRCIPQVHGTAKYCFNEAKQLLDIELNSSTDNPLVIAKDGSIRSAGNFHGQPVARALDILSLGIKDLMNISEQRTERLMEGYRDLPKFLVKGSGLNSGLMTKEIEVMAHNTEAVVPYSTMTRPTGVGKEDHVSMGPHAARQAITLIDSHLFPMLATELMAATQAIRLRLEEDKDFTIPPLLKPIFEYVNRLFPHIEKDRYIVEGCEAVEQFVKTSPVFKLACEYALPQREIGILRHKL